MGNSPRLALFHLIPEDSSDLSQSRTAIRLDVMTTETLIAPDRGQAFEANRHRLWQIAYRMLGSRAEAEDVVQEAYLRWHRIPVEEVRIPQAWLVTTVTRLAVDRLRQLRTERELYTGPWLPEPLVSEVAPPADHAVELASEL